MLKIDFPVALHKKNCIKALIGTSKWLDKSSIGTQKDFKWKCYANEEKCKNVSN